MTQCKLCDHPFDNHSITKGVCRIESCACLGFTGFGPVEETSPAVLRAWHNSPAVDGPVALPATLIAELNQLRQEARQAADAREDMIKQVEILAPEFGMDDRDCEKLVARLRELNKDEALVARLRELTKGG